MVCLPGFKLGLAGWKVLLPTPAFETVGTTSSFSRTVEVKLPQELLHACCWFQLKAVSFKKGNLKMGRYPECPSNTDLLLSSAHLTATKQPLFCSNLAVHCVREWEMLILLPLDVRGFRCQAQWVKAVSCGPSGFNGLAVALFKEN